MLKENELSESLEDYIKREWPAVIWARLINKNRIK